MTTQKTNELVSVGWFFKELHGTRFGGDIDAAEKKAAQYGIRIVGRMPLGKGEGLLMEKSQALSLLEQHRQEHSAPIETGPSPQQLHIGVLETKIDQLSTLAAGQSEAINLLIKANNSLAEKLNQVLKQLGVS